MKEKDLNKTQIEMLKKMLEWDSEYWFPYYYFDDIFEVKTLKREMRGLIAKGYVKFHRGGLNDDGEVTGGSGFTLNYGRRKEIEELVKV